MKTRINLALMSALRIEADWATSLAKPYSNCARFALSWSSVAVNAERSDRRESNRRSNFSTVALNPSSTCRR